MTARSRATEAFARIEVRAAAGEEAERLAAEAYAAGAVGLEERGEGPVTLVLYAPAAAAEGVRRALLALAGDAAVGAVAALPEANWRETWKEGLTASVISPRLVVRPSFVPRTGDAAELVIDPGQAFGTGSHATTRLALEWIDVVAPSLPRAARVLDVGSGTGVLALAVLRLSGARAVACDLDPLAAEATRENALANGLAERIDVFQGSLDALCEAGFELVVANLLRRELEPILRALAARVAPGGRAVFSGLLADESPAFEAAVGAAGLRIEGTRDAADASGEGWRAWLTRR